MFYQDVKQNSAKITWKEILSDAFKKHTKDEKDYALTAGMGFNTATEEDMLRKWHKPWLFVSTAKIGLMLMAIIFASYILLTLTGLMVNAVLLLTLVVPPLVVPITLTLFIWELNIPKNVSIIELLGCFVVGGVVSIVFTMLLNLLFSLLGLNIDFAPFAAFSEEPAKFLAAIICISFLQKKYGKKICAITAAGIGAAVGAGFSAFESAQYMLNGELASGSFGGMSTFILWRLIGSFGNHILFCAMYTAAFALVINKEKKVSAASFKNWIFWAAFLIATASHFAWNSMGSFTNSFIAALLIEIAMLVIQWLCFLWVIKKSLYQVISNAQYVSGTGVGYSAEEGFLANGISDDTVQPICIVCVEGELRGKGWKSDGPGTLLIGRSEECQLKYSAQAQGISRCHCTLFAEEGKWKIKDNNSTFGTFVNGEKLASGLSEILNDGDMLSLGGDLQVYKVSIGK